MSSPPSNPPSNRSTPAPRGRPAPRAGYTRRTKAERDRYAAEQAERDKARSATPSTATTPARGGRGAGRGARGALTREAARPSADGTGLGVFGANTGAAKFRSKDNQQGREEWMAGGPRTKDEVDAAAAAQLAGQVGGAGGVSGAGGDGGGGGGGVAGKAVHVVGPQDYLVPEDDEQQVERRDIERIWISSDDEAMGVDDDEDDIVASKGKRRATSDSKPKQRKSAVGNGLRPVRAPRAPLETDELDEEGIHSRRGLRKAKREGTAAANAQVITDDSDPMDVDQPTASTQAQPLKSPTSSPELKKKTLAGTRRPTTARTKSSAGHQETQEERAERLRVVEDTSKLLDVFAPHEDSSTTRKGKAKSSDQGRLFLLQFPPITPLLVDPTIAAAADGDDEEQEAADGVKVKSEQDPAAGGGGGASQKQKQAALQQQQQAATAGLLTADSTARLPRGFVGKLNVHASGKISLDWAGTAMEVKLGTEVDFLQDAVLLQPDVPEEEEDPGDEMDVEGDEGEGQGEKKEKKSEDGATGRAFALGQVQGKLVVTPAWGKIFD